MPRDKRDAKSTVNIKVSPRTYQRLRMYQAKMVLTCEGARSFTMDDVISALLDLVEISFTETEEQGSEEKSATPS